MEGRKLKDHIIQIYQAIKQVLSHDERQFLNISLGDYKRYHDADNLALELCKLCTSIEKVEIVQNVWTQIIHGQLSEFDQIMKDYPVGRSNQILLKVDKFSRESNVISQTGKLFDEDNSVGGTHIIKLHKIGEDTLGFCIRGGLEHGLGIYVSGIEECSVAEQSGLQLGDKILEVNNISLHSLPSSSAVKVLTGSNQLKLMIDRTGRVPEWRLSRERTVWYDCQTKKLRHGDYEEFGSYNFIRGIDVDIPEHCVTLSNVTDDEDLGFNITGGNEYRLGIYVSSVDESSKAEINGIQVGDQIMDVNGLPYDNISHAHAVETLKDHTHLIITLRDVGRYPAYKEIYAEYTWTGTSDGSESKMYTGNGGYSGERLIERKLLDTWIESNVHKKRKNLHLRVPVQVISHHDDKDGTDPLHPEIYLPENDEMSHVIRPGSSPDSVSLIRSDHTDSLKPIDTWIGGGGHSNPTFQYDDMGDNSSSDGRSVGDNSSFDDGSGIQGEYTVTMDDIIKKKEGDKKSKLNIYQYIIHKSQDNLDEGSVKDSGRKSVERYIFDDDATSHADSSLHGDIRIDINEDDIRSETLSRESLVIDDDDTQNYHSSPTFSTFSQQSHQNKNLTSLDNWKKSVESSKEENSVTDRSMRYHESNTDGDDTAIAFVRNNEISSDEDTNVDNFNISVVPGSVHGNNGNLEVRESRYKKKSDNKNKISRFKSNERRIIIDKECLDDGELSLYETMYESTDDGSQGMKNPYIKHSDENSRCISVVDKSNRALYPNSSDELDAGVNNHNRVDTSGQSKVTNIADSYSDFECSYDDINNETELVMHDFDRQIKNLENRKSDLGMFEMTNFSSPEGDESPKPTKKKERRGSIFKIPLRKPTGSASKDSSWKILKKKIRSGIFKKSTHDESARKADFVWSKYNPHTFDEEGMVLLERSAKELFKPDEVIALKKHVQTYHEDHDVDKLVDNILVCIDVPEKILVLKDVRQVIYKFDMFHFNELVKKFEIGAYEKLSTNVHLQLNHEKRRKPKKHLLQPETDAFGHFFIKPTTRQKDKDKEIQRQVIDIIQNEREYDHQPQVTLTFNSDELSSACPKEDIPYIEKYGEDVMVTRVSKQNPMLGLCISGGIECKRQPQIKIEEILKEGAAADDPRLQPGMIVLAIDDTDLRNVTHTDAILALKKAFTNKKRPNMVIVITDSVMC